MRTFANRIETSQKEVFNLDRFIRYENGQPYIFSSEFKDPYLVFSLSTSQFIKEKKYFKQWWARVDDNPQWPRFYQTVPIETPGYRTPTIDMFLWPDNTQRDQTWAVYHNVNQDTYYYWDVPYYEANLSNYKIYDVRYVKTFYYDDIKDLQGMNYVYDIRLIDGQPTFEQLKQIAGDFEIDKKILQFTYEDTLYNVGYFGGGLLSIPAPGNRIQPKAGSPVRLLTHKDFPGITYIGGFAPNISIRRLLQELVNPISEGIGEGGIRVNFGMGISSLNDPVRSGIFISLQGEDWTNQDPKYLHTAYLVLLGDLNKDGRVNITDGTYLQGYLDGNPNMYLNPSEMLAADINGDGEITIEDKILLEAYTRGLLDIFEGMLKATTPITPGDTIYPNYNEEVRLTISPGWYMWRGQPAFDVNFFENALLLSQTEMYAFLQSAAVLNFVSKKKRKELLEKLEKIDLEVPLIQDYEDVILRTTEFNVKSAVEGGKL
jgi:hypothetical protein